MSITLIPQPQHPLQPVDWLTYVECALVLGVSLQTVRKYVRNGELRATRIGRGAKVLRKDLDAFVNSRRETR